MLQILRAARPLLGLVSLAACAGCLVRLAFPPYEFAMLAWIALVPLAFLIHRDAAWPEKLFAAYLGGVLFYAWGIDWLRTSYHGTGFSGPRATEWILTSLAAALAWPAIVAIAIGIRRFMRLPYGVILPSAWIGGETVQHGMSTVASGAGFPWLPLALTQAVNPHVIQIADLGGMGLIAVVLVAVNGLIFDVWQSMRAKRAKGAVAYCLFGAAVVGFAWLYGAWRLSQPCGRPGEMVALMPNGYAVDRLLWDEKRPRASLAVWPEESSGRYFMQRQKDLIRPNEAAFVGQSTSPKIRMARGAIEYWSETARQAQLTLAIGGWRVEPRAEGSDTFNSVAVIDPRNGFLGSYDKTFLIPWAEYAPWPNIAEWFNVEHTGYTPGSGSPVFQLPSGLKFSTAVCYDVCFPKLFRHSMNSENGGPDFFVICSSEVADQTDCLQQTSLRMSQLRAVECRRAVVRSVVNGYSGLTDSNGRVLEVVRKIDASSPQCVGPVPIDTRRSFYSASGDCVPPAALAALILLVIGALFQRSREFSRTAREVR